MQTHTHTYRDLLFTVIISSNPEVERISAGCFLFQRVLPPCPGPTIPFSSMPLINEVQSLRLIRRHLTVKGPPHKPSITDAHSHSLTHTCMETSTHQHKHTHTGASSITPVAGLSEVSVISCPAWLNYDVNKSPLVPLSSPTSHM